MSPVKNFSKNCILELGGVRVIKWNSKDVPAISYSFASHAFILRHFHRVM